MPPVPRPNQCDLEIHRGVTTRDRAPSSGALEKHQAALVMGLPLTMTRALGVLA
jgi:hypothetical protein